MDDDQQCLVYLLTSFIYKKEVDCKKIENINWNKIFKISREHEIYPIIYYIIKNIEDDLKPQKGTMLEWSKESTLSSISQLHNINKVTSVIKEINKAGIEVMGLKGLVLRELYIVKELRNMTDVDILIHYEDFDKVKKILLDFGYFEEYKNLTIDKDSKDMVFLHKSFLPIELHWHPVDTKLLKNTQCFENSIWKDTKKLDICGAKILVPSSENQVLHLCLHMAAHFIYSGFGLRQLCDFVILIAADGSKINWKNFYEKIKECRIKSFTIAIFEVCRRLFSIDVPNLLYDTNIMKSEYIDMIMDNIFDRGVYGGIYGKISLDPVSNNLLDCYKNNRKADNLLQQFKDSLFFFFPTSQKLSERYIYAKRCRILLPIAWLHRITYGAFRKDFKLKQKKIILFKRSDFFKKQLELFDWLNL